ncbi:MAG: hypothetical protein GYB64_18075 [Chloroflexi bacterium]|nr:hypothetical protein [Chloroflexota bacterium]
MREYTCAPEVEVLGGNVLGFIHNVQEDEIKPALEKMGLTEIKPEEWYPLKDWLEVLNDLNRRGNTMYNFVAVGIGIAENAPFPPEVEQMPPVAVFEMLDTVYQAHHRGGDVGKIIVEKVADQHLKITLDGIVYPDDLEYGVAYGFAKRFLPEDSDFLVEYEEGVTRLDDDGEKTIIHISW